MKNRYLEEKNMFIYKRKPTNHKINIDYEF